MRTAAAMARRLAKRSFGRWLWRETYCCLRLPWNQARSAAADVGAFVGDKLVSYCFFAARPTAIDSYLQFHFPLRWIYVYKALTLASWRDRRLQQQVFLRALPEVDRWLHGLRQPLGFVTLVVTDNAASMSAFARLGFKSFESFAVLRIRSRPRLISPPEERTEFYVEATA